VASILAAILPELVSRLGEVPASYPLPAEQARLRLFEAVGELIAWSALDRPVLLVLDDLHLADAASMALLAYLGRRLPEQPAFVLGTRRGAPASARLDATVEGLDRRGIMAPELVLAPLPAGAVHAIVAGAAPTLDADELTRLQYRYLDLRRPEMARVLRLRARLNAIIRGYLDERGFVEVNDRQGNPRKFPLLTLSVGVATTKNRHFSHYGEAVAIATEMKQVAKARQGSGFAIDRRSG